MSSSQLFSALKILAKGLEQHPSSCALWVHYLALVKLNSSHEAMKAQRFNIAEVAISSVEGTPGEIYSVCLASQRVQEDAATALSAIGKGIRKLLEHLPGSSSHVADLVLRYLTTASMADMYSLALDLCINLTGSDNRGLLSDAAQVGNEIRASKLSGVPLAIVCIAVAHFFTQGYVPSCLQNRLGFDQGIPFISIGKTNENNYRVAKGVLRRAFWEWPSLSQHSRAAALGTLVEFMVSNGETESAKTEVRSLLYQSGDANDESDTGTAIKLACLLPCQTLAKVVGESGLGAVTEPIWTWRSMREELTAPGEPDGSVQTPTESLRQKMAVTSRKLFDERGDGSPRLPGGISKFVEPFLRAGMEDEATRNERALAAIEEGMTKSWEMDHWSGPCEYEQKRCFLNLLAAHAFSGLLTYEDAISRALSMLNEQSLSQLAQFKEVENDERLWLATNDALVGQGVHKAKGPIESTVLKVCLDECQGTDEFEMALLEHMAQVFPSGEFAEACLRRNDKRAFACAAHCLGMTRDRETFPSVWLDLAQSMPNQESRMGILRAGAHQMPFASSLRYSAIPCIART